MMLYRSYFFLIFIAIASKITAIYFTKFDLFGDEAQYWVWSQNLDFGYYSKPPLLAWIIRLVTSVFGSSFEAIKLIPFVAYFLTSYVVFLISFELYKKKKLAIISGISFYLMPAVTVSSFLISTDVFLIFFWSLAVLFILKIRNKPSLINFLLLGVFLGLSFLTKYAAVYFFISLLTIVIFDEKIRKIFKKNIFNVVAFLSSTFIILLPNLIWNTKNSWVTFSHTSDNAGLNRLNFNLIQGVEFIITQGLMIGPVLFIFFLIRIKKIQFNFETKFLLSFSLPIIIIVLIESMLVRANANWAAVSFVCLFIFIIEHAYALSKRIIFINNLFGFLFGVIFFISISLSLPIKIFDRINGISSFAKELSGGSLSQNKYLVIEDRILFSNLKYIYRNSNKIILTPYFYKNPIKSHFHITSPLLKNFNKNFIFIGDPNSINYLLYKNKITNIYSSKKLFLNSQINIYEVTF